MRYFAGRTGWPDTYEKNYEMRIGSVPLSWNGRITQNSFWARARQLKKHQTGPHRMALCNKRIENFLVLLDKSMWVFFCFFLSYLKNRFSLPLPSYA